MSKKTPNSKLFIITLVCSPQQKAISHAGFDETTDMKKETIRKLHLFIRSLRNLCFRLVVLSSKSSTPNKNG